MVYLILGNGFEEIEALTPVDILRRGGVEIRTAGIGGLLVEGAHGITVQADCTVEEMDLNAMEMVILPGGLGGVQSMDGSEAAVAAVRRAHADGKYVAAICAAPTLLSKLGITHGRRCTSYPGTDVQMDGAIYVCGEPVVVDGNLITSRGPGTATVFALQLLQTLRGRETAERVAEELVLA